MWIDKVIEAISSSFTPVELKLRNLLRATENFWTSIEMDAKRLRRLMMGLLPYPIS